VRQVAQTIAVKNAGLSKPPQKPQQQQQQLLLLLLWQQQLQLLLQSTVSTKEPTSGATSCRRPFAFTMSLPRRNMN